MKVLLFAPNYFPATRYGGPIRSVHGLAKGLVQLGHEVVVLTTNVDGSSTLEVPLNRPVDMDGVQVYYSPITHPRRLYFSPALARIADSLVPGMDVIHVNGMFLWPGPYLSRAARRAGIRLIISPRGMLMPRMIAGSSPRLKAVWIRFKERLNLASASAIHATSKLEADGIQQTMGRLKRVEIIANGVQGPSKEPCKSEIEKFWSHIPQGQRIGFLGRLDWTKGVPLAVEAVRQHPYAQLLIAGHDQIGFSKRLSERLRRDDGSLCGAFIGALNDFDKWAFLSGADVLLVPSISESFGLSVAEAMLMGTAVISTNGVGASDLLRRIDPALVVPRDQTALTSALTALLADHARRAWIERESRKLAAEELNWDDIARRMTTLYCGVT